MGQLGKVGHADFPMTWENNPKQTQNQGGTAPPPSSHTLPVQKGFSRLLLWWACLLHGPSPHRCHGWEQTSGFFAVALPSRAPIVFLHCEQELSVQVLREKRWHKWQTSADKWLRKGRRNTISLSIVEITSSRLNGSKRYLGWTLGCVLQKWHQLHYLQHCKQQQCFKLKQIICRCDKASVFRSL